MDKKEKERLRASEYYKKNRVNVLKRQSERYFAKVKNSPRRRFNIYKHDAKKRNYCFELSFNEFMELWQVRCKYCGVDIKTIGVDRIDNSIGYTKENIVPCCRECNRMKGKLSTKEFIYKCKLIAEGV